MGYSPKISPGTAQRRAEQNARRLRIATFRKKLFPEVNKEENCVGSSMKMVKLTF